MLYWIYMVIVAILAVVVLVELVRERSWKMQLSMAMLLMVFVLRILQIK